MAVGEVNFSENNPKKKRNPKQIRKPTDLTRMTMKSCVSSNLHRKKRPPPSPLPNLEAYFMKEDSWERPPKTPSRRIVPERSPQLLQCILSTMFPSHANCSRKQGETYSLHRFCAHFSPNITMAPGAKCTKIMNENIHQDICENVLALCCLFLLFRLLVSLFLSFFLCSFFSFFLPLLLPSFRPPILSLFLFFSTHGPIAQRGRN